LDTRVKSIAKASVAVLAVLVALLAARVTAYADPGDDQL